MSEEQFRSALRALAAELDEAIAGCDEIDVLLGEILARSGEGD
jgi:hypothetical protein